MTGKSLRGPGIKPGSLNISMLLVALVYAATIAISLDKCYFWDNVQFTSKEAHWYYSNNFTSLLLPGFSEGLEMFGSGCHPPLPGIMTALLWKVLGQHIWVSHLFTAFWAALLIYSTGRLLKITLPQESAGFVLPVLLLDSTILSQIFIASPDLMLLASFITAVVAVFERKRWLLTMALIFLVLINGRGAATSGIVLILYLVHQVIADKRRFTLKLFISALLPFIPAFTLAGFYYILYITRYGWIFNDPASPWYSGWQKPEGLLQILKNIAAFCLRLGENGRFIIYLTGIYLLTASARKKLKRVFSSTDLSLALLFGMLFLFFFYFVLTTTAAMTSRYYMGMFLILGVLIFRSLAVILPVRKIKIIAVASLVFLLTGNLWMYPDKISKAWDATLAHLPYYELRHECFDYIKNNNINFAQVSGGFCFMGNQRYVDLEDRDLRISEGTENRYYIYSNISNPGDKLIDDLKDSSKWSSIRTFRKGFLTVSLYENRLYALPGEDTAIK